MNFLMAFIIGGLICLVGQLLMDLANLLPVHITVLFVSLGALFEAFGLYDMLIKIGHAGALVPISSFGHSLTHAALEASKDQGYIGLFLGMFDLTNAGICSAILFAFLSAVIFRPKN